MFHSIQYQQINVKRLVSLQSIIVLNYECTKQGDMCCDNFTNESGKNTICYQKWGNAVNYFRSYLDLSKLK